MRASYSRSRILLFSVLVSLFFAASPLFAYLDELTEADVDEAYTLGQRHDQDLAKFFKTYEVQFPNAVSGMHVSRIAIRTPYYSVVLNSFLRGSIYPMSQARADYAAKPYPFMAVISISLPFANSWSADDLSKPDGRFWKQFAIEVTQGAKIPPRAMTARPLYSYGSDGTWANGAEMLLEYDVRDVASRTIQVRVIGPDRQPVSAEFDLDTLK